METMRKIQLVHGDLSFKIIGALFDVYNELGYGHKEVYYQRALAKEFESLGLAFEEQVHIPLMFKGDTIGKLYLDFVIEGKVVIELKKDGRFARKNIEQINQYLKSSGLKLGIIANYTPEGVKYKRIVNIVQQSVHP